MNSDITNSVELNDLVSKNRGKVITTKKDYYVYKKCYCAIVQLMIPKGSKIVVPRMFSSYGSFDRRKLRCNRAIVTCILGYNRFLKDSFNNQILNSCKSRYSLDFIYKIGEVVKPKKKFSDDVTDSCRSGIHFFINLEDAERY